jgi:lipid A ethanolaminephosphotransferase
MHPLMLVAVAVATVFTIYNETFWGLWSDVFDGNFPSGVKFAAAFFLLCCALLGTLAFRAVLRPLIAGFFLVSAVTSYYMDELGVVIDREMIQNVVSTTLTEGKHLITAPLRFLGYHSGNCAGTLGVKGAALTTHASADDLAKWLVFGALLDRLCWAFAE